TNSTQVFGEGNRVRKIDVNGIVSTVAGTNTTGYVGYSGDGGLAIYAQVFLPQGIITDAVGRVFFADYGNHCIRKIDTNGIISTVAGIGGMINAGYSGDGGQATTAKLRGPTDIAIDNAGNLFIADMENHCIRKVNTNGII